MKIAVMSDVHANPTALRTALTDAQAQGCERFFFLGDVTGYGYDVKAALDLVRERFELVLMGNHDSVLLKREAALLVMLCPNYDLDIRQRSELSAADTAWLRAGRFVHREAGAVFVHADLTAPEDWRYILDDDAAKANFARLEETFLFCGHSHCAELWEQAANGTVSRLLAERFNVPATEPESVTFTAAAECRYIVNVGSVGNPRNDYCSCYAIYEPEARRVTVRRLPFDFFDFVVQLQAHGVERPRWLVDLLDYLQNLNEPHDKKEVCDAVDQWHAGGRPGGGGTGSGNQHHCADGRRGVG